jgi:hypothetical protein
MNYSITSTLITLFFSSTFLFDQITAKSLVAAEIPPHKRIRIACQHYRPRTFLQ